MRLNGTVVKTWVVIGAAALLIEALWIWKVQSPGMKSCRSEPITSATDPDNLYIARADFRTCDEGVESGLFVMISKSVNPRWFYHAFHSARRLNVVSLRWLDERNLEVTFSEALDASERKFDGRNMDGRVKIHLKDTGGNIGPVS